MGVGTFSAGRRGEALARGYLEGLGYRLLESNWHSGHDELDLIMDDRGTTVFVEVKSRGEGALGIPAEAVDAPKQRRMTRAAWAYLAARGSMNSSARFDVVEVYLGSGTIRHIPNAFYARER